MEFSSIFAAAGHVALRCRTAGIVWCTATILAIVALVIPFQTSAMTVSTDRGPVEVYRHSIALVIGASRYTRGWDNLDTVPSEISNVAAALREHGFEVQELPNPTSANLRPAIQRFLLQSVERDTRLLIYFAGHGWTDNKFTGYIVPTDAPPQDSRDFVTYPVGMDDILRMSQQSRAKHVLFVFDSCFSGAVFLTRHNLIPSELFLSDADQQVRQIITAGSATDEVPSRSDFAEAFVRGLRGEADIVPDGVITANELGYWLKAEISRLGRQTPQYGSSLERGYRYGDVMFLPASSPAATRRIAAAAPRTRAADATNVRSFGRPSEVRSQMFSGISIYYYEKSGDEGRVERALDAGHVPYVRTRASLPDRFQMNAIACGPDIPAEILQQVATTLIDGGVQIRAIIRFREPERKQRRIELLSLTQDATGERLLDSPPLTIQQIEQLLGCDNLSN